MAAYVELDTDPLPGVTTTLAGRFEHFSDFGSTWNGKFAARWEPVTGYALRGSVSNGFRAPSLHQQFFTTTSTNFGPRRAGGYRDAIHRQRLLPRRWERRTSSRKSRSTSVWAQRPIRCVA